MLETHAASIVTLAEVLTDFCTPDELTKFTPKAQAEEGGDLYKERTQIATRLHAELEAHRGEHREALDALNGVIRVKVDKGERDIRSQLSAIREALTLLGVVSEAEEVLV